MKTTFSILTVILLLIFIQEVKSQEWTVPAEQAKIENPLPYNLQNVTRGKDLYQKNCKSCHGDAGKNNALPLVPPPPDMASEKIQKNSQGELFYKITLGRGTMPQFEKSLSEDDRWRIVNYIQNFNPAKEALLVDAPKINAKLLGSVNEAEKKVEVFAEFENPNGAFSKLGGAPVIISAKTTFGKLKIGEAVTDENGRAVYIIPETTKGDPEGNIDLVVTLDENYKVNELILENANVCKPYEAENLFANTVLWGTNDRLQPWLLFSYLAAAGGAWLAILYVIFQLFKIKKMGKQNSGSV